MLDRIAPDLCLSPWAPNGYTDQYPFSVRPQAKLSITDVFDLYRDHYEGTPFDLTRGTAAGPYGDPARLVGPYDGKQNNLSNVELRGAWERPISIFYQGFTTVCQSRDEKEVPAATSGLIWFGPDTTYTTCFVPLPAVGPLPAEYSTESPKVFDRTNVWWAFNFVSKWCRLDHSRGAPHRRHCRIADPPSRWRGISVCKCCRDRDGGCTH